MTKPGKKIIQFYNRSGSLEKVIEFLESVQKKVNFIDLQVDVDGTKEIKVTLFGSRDVQHLAIEKLRDLATQILTC